MPSGNHFFFRYHHRRSLRYYISFAYARGGMSGGAEKFLQLGKSRFTPDLTKRKKSYVKAQDTILSVWYGDSKQTKRRKQIKARCGIEQQAVKPRSGGSCPGSLCCQGR